MGSTFRPRWAALLEEAVNRPGLILDAYTKFYGYSFGNQVAAFSQCLTRGIEPGPIATFNAWRTLGRSVKRGSKAIWLCVPVTVVAQSPDPDDEEPRRATYFVWRPRWFVLSQTEGDPYQPESIPGWSKDRALAALGITEVEFSSFDGNTQGYAKGREISINPLASLPSKTLFHELGHVLLGHTAEGETRDGHDLPRSLREAEAESVALLCLDALGLPGGDFCRGYIQHWIGKGDPIPEASAARIFGEADAILKAGQPEIS